MFTTILGFLFIFTLSSNIFVELRDKYKISRINMSVKYLMGYKHCVVYRYRSAILKSEEYTYPIHIIGYTYVKMLLNVDLKCERFTIKEFWCASRSI